jgi:ABC-2 type transport system ATP-binding protein
MIEVQQLSKTYGTTAAIENLDFRVETGEILGFLGPNGAGKTTTMRILTGYLPASHGTAKVAGYDVHDQTLEVRQRIGYLPENPPLYLDMTVESYLSFVARLKGVPRKQRKSRITWSIERCQLEDKRNTLIRKLSKGYRQRVGIAQAIVHDPPVIILDEPTVGLDPRQHIEVRKLIKSLAGEHTIILSTHILPEVSMTCDRVTIINQGKVVATDTPDNLMAQLAGGKGYELEVGGDTTNLESFLNVIPGVATVEVKPLELDNRYLVKIITTPNAEPGRDIAAVIVGAGLGLYEMRRTAATLEDVFLEVTTQETLPPLAETEAETTESSTSE